MLEQSLTSVDIKKDLRWTELPGATAVNKSLISSDILTIAGFLTHQGLVYSGQQETLSYDYLALFIIFRDNHLPRI